jgi:hypothetical protein
MFQKEKHTAFILFSVFVLRLFLGNIALFASADTHQVKPFALHNIEALKYKGLELAEQGAKANLVPAEVSEESTEDDTSENLTKASKYPSFLLAFSCDFKSLIYNVSLSGLTQSISTQQSSRTYLSISVLRI